MEIAARTLQRGLIAMGYDVGPSGADGDIGPRTRTALQTWLATLPPGTDFRTIPLGNTAMTIEPDPVGQMIVDAAAAYHAPHHDDAALVVDRPAPLATFWRRSNPYAWLVVLLPVALALGATGYYFTRAKRPRYR
jgi:hypothetical protein